MLKRYILSNKRYLNSNVNITIKLLALAVWLQMWAISTSSFGISISTIILVLYALVRFKSLKFNTRLVLFTIAIIIGMILISWINKLPPEIWVMRTFRYVMLLAIVIICQSLFTNKDTLKEFLKALYHVVVVGCIYGLYQYIAPKFNLPYFLNIFNNNNSFSPKDIFSYYGGWVDQYRIYGVFSEPSFYGSFLALFLLIILFVIRPPKVRGIIVWILILSNIFLTYSRAAYSIAIAVFVLYFISTKFIIKKNLLYYAVGFGLILIPIFMPFMMNYMYINNVFTDASMSGRAISQTYYFKQSLETTSFFGNGVGSITYNSEDKAEFGGIEQHAHNAIASLTYELGWLSTLIYALLMIRFLITSTNYKFSLTFVGAVAVLLSFGEAYSIESTLILLCVLANVRKVQADIKPLVHAIK